jgi:hypothetical protein
MKKILWSLLGFIPLLANAQVVINELNCDNPGGADTREFIELYGAPNQSLDSLVIVLFDGATGTSYNAFDLDGWSCNASGFFVAGNALTTNVNLVFANAGIQNGPDAVAIYRADATDFPTGTAPSTTDLIDAMVYGTNDAPATNLITGLGLDVLFPNYTQLDETAQAGGTGPDLTISRIPDGGVAFDWQLYVTQGLTPGTYNLPPCSAGPVVLIDSSTPTTYCDNAAAINLAVQTDATTQGDSYFFVLTNAGGTILSTSTEGLYNLVAPTAGVYQIYVVAISGTLVAGTADSGLPITGIQGSVCASIGTTPLSITINQCGGCLGGLVQDSGGSSSSAICASTTSFDLSTTSTSIEDNYLFVLADTNNQIISTFNGTLSTTGLNPGLFRIYGVSYIGTLNSSTVQAGQNINGITSSICATLSDNFYALTIYDCVSISPCTELFFSEYLEGTGSNKALEIFNPTLQPVDLTGYTVMTYNNGATTPNSTLDLAGVIAPYGTYVIAFAGGAGGPGGGQPDAALLASSNITSNVANYNGNDAIELRHNNEVIDVIGVVGEDPGNNQGWVVGNGSTINNDLVRKISVQSPTNIWAISADQWDVYGPADYSHLGSHQFNSCATEALVGFTATVVNVNETAGTITITVQAFNITTPTNISVNVGGGTATSGVDYTINLPITLTFDGTSNTQTFTIAIVDDADAEPDETIILDLSGTGSFTWINQQCTVVILQSDPNCAGGFIQNANGGGGPGGGAVTQCSDEPNTPVSVNFNSNTPANYVFVVTTATDSILAIFSSSPISLDGYAAGTYRIRGLSYTGTLDPLTTGEGNYLYDISSDTCASVSANFITVNRQPCIITGCDGGIVTLTDSTSVISLCAGTPVALSLETTGASIDDIYTYFLTTSDSTIISQVGTNFNVQNAVVGDYLIFGVSYQGTLTASSIAAGQPISGISASTCAQLSLNAVEIHLWDCSNVQTCGDLFISEYLEGTGANRAIEIYNPSTDPVDLSTYSINIYVNGASPPVNIPLTGTLAGNDVYVLAPQGGGGPNQLDPAITAVADLIDPNVNFNGNDAIELLSDGAVIDVVGDTNIVIANGQGWPLGILSTANFDLVRRPIVSSPNTDWQIVRGQWVGYPANTFNHLGSHTSSACTNSQAIGFLVDSLSVDEAAGTVTLLVQAYGITEPVVFTLSVSGTATDGLDFTTNVSSLSFDPVNTFQSITLTIIDDALIEGNETIVITLTAPITLEWTANTCTVTIVDNDGVGIAENRLVKVNGYPNPFMDVIHLTSDSPIRTVLLSDISGRKVLSQQGQYNNFLDVSTTALPAGQYLMEIQTDKGIVRTKMVKLN